MASSCTLGMSSVQSAWVDARGGLFWQGLEWRGLRFGLLFADRLTLEPDSDWEIRGDDDDDDDDNLVGKKGDEQE